MDGSCHSDLWYYTDVQLLQKFSNFSNTNAFLTRRKTTFLKILWHVKLAYFSLCFVVHFCKRYEIESDQWENETFDWFLTTVENCKWRNLCLIILEVVFPSIRSSVWKRSRWIEKSNQNTASSKPVAMLLLLINDPRDKDRLTLTDANGRPTQGCTWL